MNPVLKRIVRIVGIVVAVLVVLILGLGAYVLASWDKTHDRSVPQMIAPRDSATLARGEYIYKYSALCWGCHASGTPDATSSPSGGEAFDLGGLGVYYSRNITQDKETGLGDWTDGEIVQALREGIRKNRHALFPLMPVDWYKGLSDEDVLALVAYLRTLPPVHNVVPAHERSFLSKALFAFNAIKPLPEITQPVVAPMPGPTVEYGKYLANNLAGCADCHTPRNLQNGKFYLDSLFAGSSFAFGGAEGEPLLAYARNITPDQNTGIGRWTEDQFIAALRAGVRPDSIVLSLHMPYAYYGLWNVDDLKAVYRYLKTVPAVNRTVPTAKYAPEASMATGVARGKIIYVSHCVGCHGVNGAGAVPTNAKLAELAPSLDEITLKEFIRDGQIELRMPGFKKTLTADELNDLVAFIRSLNTVASTN